MIDKKHAFTLAEVLITLGIIGVVAAMTIPNLINKISERNTIVKLNKVYATLQQAYKYAENEYGEPSLWSITERNKENAIIIREKLFFKTKQSVNCDDTDDFTKCGFWKDYIAGHSASKATALQLSDGTSISILPNPSDNLRRGTSPSLQDCWAWIDVYLHTKKNYEDYFRFYLTGSGIIPVGTKEETSHTFDERCLTRNQGMGGNSKVRAACAAWVLKNNNMDYIHCSDLSWNGKHTCK